MMLCGPCARLLGQQCTSVTSSRAILRIDVRWRGARAKLPKLADLSKLRDNSSDLRRLLRLAKPVRWRLAAGIGLLFISSSVSISVPLMFGKMMDLASTSKAEGEKEDKEEATLTSMISSKYTLKEVCAALAVVFAVGALANFGRVYLMTTSSAIVTNSLRTKVYSSILRQEMAFFDHSKTGELVNRLSNDATMVGHAVSTNISDGLRASAMALGSTAMMIYVSPELAVVGLSVVPVVGGMAVVYGRFVKKITKKMNDSLAAATQVADERISGIRTVRAFAAEEKETALYGKRIDTVVQLAFRESKARALFFASAGWSGNCMMLAILYTGGSLITAGTMTIGQLSSFLVYAIYVGVSIEGLAGFYGELMRGVAAGSRLFELAERRPVIPVVGGAKPTNLIGHVQFRDVHFAYHPVADAVMGRADAAEKGEKGEKGVTDEKEEVAVVTSVLNGVNLDLSPGSVTAIVGASGCGKSTIASLLLRFYDPTDGSISLDGADLRGLDPTWLRNNVSIVPQEPQLFSTSVGENIAYGLADPTAVTSEQLVDAARQANALEFINALPNMFDTVLGERGMTLSGGQRQRIAIARALISQPKLLVLDEATSALDAESEYQVRRALHRLLRQQSRTVLIIAHRLSTIRNADQIAVLHDGVVAELGTFEQLAGSEGGRFKELIDKQTFSQYTEESF